MSTLQSTTPQQINAASRHTGKAARRFTTFVGIVICVILIAIFICNLTLIVKGYTDKDEVPSLFGISTMYVLTGSMEPTINEGDLVFVRKVLANEIVVGDVIAFFDPVSEDKVMVAHRVKAVVIDDNGNTFFVTIGDANDSVDTVAVPADNLVGKYVGRLPYMGRIAIFLQSTAGLIITVSVPLLMLLCFELIRYLRKSRNKSVASHVATFDEHKQPNGIATNPQQVEQRIDNVQAKSSQSKKDYKKYKKKSKKHKKSQIKSAGHPKVQVKIKKYK